MLRQLFPILLVFLLGSLLSGQSFPAETIVCRAGSFTLESPLTDGQAYVYQWERSFDGGGSWLPTGTNAPSLEISNPNSGILYRMAYAPDAACLGDIACRTVTTATRLVVTIPSFAQGMTLCAGDTVFVGTTPLTTPGTHQTILTTAAGCDSIVETFLEVLPAYDELFFVDLCPGELFRGQEIGRDTIITERFTAASGCDSTVTFEVNLAFSDNPAITGPDRLCAGEVAVLTAPGAYAGYEWSDGSAGQQVTAATSGVYTLEITDFLGCTLELSHELVITDLSIDDVVATPPTCPGEPSGTLDVQATGDVDLLYSINGGEGFQLDGIFTELPAGDYDVMVENAEGCQVSQRVTVADAPALNLVANQPAELTIERGDSVPFAITADFPVVEYNWSTSSFLSCDDCPDPMAYPPVDVAITVEAVAAGGCSVSQVFSIAVKDSRRLYAPTAFSPNADDRNDRWRIYTGPRAEAISGLQIADRWGGIRFQQPEPALPPMEAGWDGRDRNGQEMDAGTYLFTATIHYADGSTKTIGGSINLMR